MTGNEFSVQIKNGEPFPPVIDMHVHAIPESLLRKAAERETDGVSAARTDGGWLVTLPGAKPALVRSLMTDRERRLETAASRVRALRAGDGQSLRRCPYTRSCV